MPESNYRKQPLKNLSDAPRDDLEDIIKNLVENGHVSADLVNREMDKVRAKAANSAAEAAKNSGEIAKVSTKISEDIAKTKPKPEPESKPKPTPEPEPSSAKSEKVLSPEAREKLLQILKLRFTMNRRLHEKTRWADVERALRANPEAMWSLNWMESTGGEPDVIEGDYHYHGYFKFVDCSKESPWGRKNVVFDRKGEENLKKHSPDEMCNGNAEDIAEKHGVIIMDSETYKDLQEIIRLDLNSSSWLRRKISSFYFQPMLGSYFNNAVHVVESNTDNHEPTRSFRAILGVLVVGKDED